MIRFISNVITPITRIFSPTDDNYPSTGVQPFEGDPADKKRSEI
ncbi:MAG: isochorismate synthase [Leptolyngbyaceae cyanobacterium SM1_4_3]|nr:isochorismate synthase [Leptolyngbyaceae cyanobacterium SM1_4_3]